MEVGERITEVIEKKGEVLMVWITPKEMTRYGLPRRIVERGKEGTERKARYISS